MVYKIPIFLSTQQEWTPILLLILCHHRFWGDEHPQICFLMNIWENFFEVCVKVWNCIGYVLNLTGVLQKGCSIFIPISHLQGSSKKQESSRKTSISALLTMPKPLTVWITTNCGKFWKRWEYQTTWPASWETCMQVRKQQLDLDMDQQTGFK